MQTNKKITMTQNSMSWHPWRSRPLFFSHTSLSAWTSFPCFSPLYPLKFSLNVSPVELFQSPSYPLYHGWMGLPFSMCPYTAHSCIIVFITWHCSHYCMCCIWLSASTDWLLAPQGQAWGSSWCIQHMAWYLTCIRCSDVSSLGESKSSCSSPLPLGFLTAWYLRNTSQMGNKVQACLMIGKHHKTPKWRPSLIKAG